MRNSSNSNLVTTGPDGCLNRAREEKSHTATTMVKRHRSGSYPDYLGMETMRLAEYNNPVTLVKRSSAGGKFPLSYQDIVPEPSYRLAEVGIEH
jgi:hypothetical protein